MSDYRKDAIAALNASDGAIAAADMSRAGVLVQQAIAYALLDLSEAVQAGSEADSHGVEALQGIDQGVTAIARVMER